MPEGNIAGDVILSIILAGFLALLFFRALGILQNLSVAIYSVGGTSIFLIS